MAETVVILSELLLVLAISIAVRVIASRIGISYIVGLVLVGFAVAILGIELAIPLSSDLIMVVFLPTVLFQGATEIEPGHFWDNLPFVLVITVFGLPLAILFIGWVGNHLLGFSLLVSLLFATIVYPVDPVSVIRIFREVDAPPRLAALVESESHLGDGFVIVMYTTIVAVLLQTDNGSVGLGTLWSLSDALTVAWDIVFVSLGGLVVGIVSGIAVYLVLRAEEERMVDLLLTIFLPYGSFLLADRLLGVSGVLATVAAGLVIGSYGKRDAIHPDNVNYLENMWDAAAFLISTYLFLLIGMQVSVGELVRHLDLVVLTVVLVLVTRATVVYTLVGALNRASSEAVARNYQHIMVWSGLHTVVPVALVLSLPDGIPLRETLQAMVLGVAVLSIVFQGSLLPYVLRMVIPGSASQYSKS
ncbi:cation:proton antiporter [Haloferax sp. YSSS75]|uniref:cation:proton antiporter n=1 Tax=Haloferax sp. YSSS75 TaxID=3388564 RepID=UPI00398CDFB0